MTSSRLAITDFLLVEYSYSTKTVVSSDFEYSVVRSMEDEYVQLMEIGNTTQSNMDRESSVVEVNSTIRYVGGSVNALELEHSDTIVTTTYSPLHSVAIPMDTIKVYIKSGYTFTEDVKGILLSLHLLDSTTGIKFKLCHYKFTTEDYTKIRYPKTPIVISEVVYDSYLDISVPGPKHLISGSIPIASDLGFTSLDPAIYLTVSTITGQIVSPANTGITYVPGTSTTVSIAHTEPLDVVGCTLIEHPGYFEYGGITTLDEYSFEDYVYEIMGTGISLLVSHSIQVWEHMDGESTMTASYTTIQSSNFHKLLKFKPILEYPDSVRAISIDYTMSILNTKTGHSIVKSSSLTTDAVDKFRMSSTSIRLAGDVYSHKLYVTTKTPSVQVHTQRTSTPTPVVVPMYVNVSSIDLLSTEDKHIVINPGFVTTHKFTIIQRQDSTIKAVELDSVSNYYLVFFGQDNDKIYVPETKSNTVSRAVGELLFSIPESVSTRLTNTPNHKFYIITKSPTTPDTVLVQGTWELQ